MGEDNLVKIKLDDAEVALNGAVAGVIDNYKKAKEAEIATLKKAKQDSDDKKYTFDGKEYGHNDMGNLAKDACDMKKKYDKLLESSKDMKSKADSFEKELATLKEDSQKKELIDSGLIEKQKADSLSLSDTQLFILENNGFTKDEIAKIDGRSVDGAIAMLIKTASRIPTRRDSSEYDRKLDSLNSMYTGDDTPPQQMLPKTLSAYDRKYQEANK